MTDHGSANEPDLWANTGNQPSVPPPPTGTPDAASEPTTTQAATSSAPEPTVVQPVTPGPLSAPGAAAAAAAPGYVTGPGTPPPPTPPTQPPTGGPGGPGGPTGPGGPGGERPAWVVPTAIGIGVAVLGAGLVFAFTRGDDGDDAVSTDVSSTTSIPADTTTIPETSVAVETTIGAETTVVPDTTIVETTVAPTVAPTTGAPTTEAPTTVPSTEPPTTDASSGITPAQPGQALVAGNPFDLASACVTNPVAGYSVRSYVALDGSGPLVIEEGNDEGNAFGMYSESGNPIETGEYVELGNGFGMLALQGDGSFEVAVDPGSLALNDCSTTGSARASAPEAPEFGYTYGFVDMCATTAPFRAIAYLSEGGTLRIADNGDGTAQLTLNTPNLFDASDAAAALTANGSRLTIEGEVFGATIDGDTTQRLDVELDTAAARGCTSAESP